MAAVKLPEIVSNLLVASGEISGIKVVVTKNGKFFIPFNKDFPVPMLSDEDEWKDWKTVGDPVLHIELRNWADIL